MAGPRRGGSALLLGFGAYFGYLIGSTSGPTAPGQAGRTSTGSSTGPSIVTAGGYTQRYSAVQFTLGGGGCQSGDIVVPSWVTFIGSGPQVTAFASTIQVPGGGNGDMELDCVLPIGNAAPAIDFSGSQAAAQVTGTPGPSECENKIRTAPLTGSIPISALTKGTQFCVEATSGLLARVTLLSANDKTYDLTWTVTAWSPPA